MMIRLLAIAAMALAPVGTSSGAKSTAKAAKSTPAAATRTVVLDVTGMH